MKLGCCNSRGWLHQRHHEPDQELPEQVWLASQIEKVAGTSQTPSNDKTHQLVRQKRYGMAPLRAPAKEDIMRVGSFVTLFSVIVILFLAMVPALAQATQTSPTGRDWAWINGTVALIATAIWYFMRSGRRA